MADKWRPSKSVAKQHMPEPHHRTHNSRSGGMRARNTDPITGFLFFFYQALWDLHHGVIRSLFRGERWKNGCILYIIAIYKSDKKLTELGVFLFSLSVAGSRKVRLKYGASGSDVYYSFSIISSINPLKWGVYLVLQHPCFSPVHFQPPPSPLPHGQFCAIF